MSGDYSQVTEPTIAIRASLRDLLQSQMTTLRLAPQWLWEFEFGLHIWPLLERAHRANDQEAIRLVEQIQKTQNVSRAVHLIQSFLENQAPENPPW